jgi:hypothetical protein
MPLTIKWPIPFRLGLFYKMKKTTKTIINPISTPIWKKQRSKEWLKKQIKIL